MFEFHFFLSFSNETLSIINTTTWKPTPTKPMMPEDLPVKGSAEEEHHSSLTIFFILLVVGKFLYRSFFVFF